MARFFVETLPEAGAAFRLDGENAKHAKVLRLRPDEEITLCDGAARECVCRFLGGEDFLAGEAAGSPGEPAISAAVYLAFPKADKLEHVIQKATELGATEIVAFPTRFCVSRPDEKSLKNKLERWQKIAQSAAEQSRRGRIPAVRALPSYAAALKEAAQAELPILFYENEKSRTLRAAIEAGPDDRRRGRLRRRRDRSGRGRRAADLHPRRADPALRDRAAGRAVRPDVRGRRALSLQRK